MLGMLDLHIVQFLLKQSLLYLSMVGLKILWTFCYFGRIEKLISGLRLSSTFFQVKRSMLILALNIFCLFERV